MPIYKKTAELARKFDSAYPPELFARLQWWGDALGINRVRLLRLLGMSKHQAEQRKNCDLQEIIRNPKWKENVQLVEASLLRLLSLFHYDWPALAERIHSPVAGVQQEGPSRVTRGKGEVTRLQYTPNGASFELLINRVIAGGPDSLSALLAYLS